MKLNKNRIIPIILVCLSCVLFIVAIVLIINTNQFSFKNQVGNQDNKESQVKEEITNKNEEIKDKDNSQIKEKENNDKQEETKNAEVDNNQSSIQDNNTVTNQESNKQEEVDDSQIINNETLSTTTSNNNDDKVETTKSENDVINYFALEDTSISNVNQDDRTLREKAKDSFVTVVNFIFYDKEIKGYTFKELTTSAKLQVIKIALSIDHKIDEYFPDYKDVIKDKYTNIKGKLSVKYLEFTSTLCESVGEDTCNQAKEDFNTMKESFGITWQLVKELASSGSSKVKDFYESWRDSE